RAGASGRRRSDAGEARSADRRQVERTPRPRRPDVRALRASVRPAPARRAGREGQGPGRGGGGRAPVGAVRRLRGGGRAARGPPTGPPKGVLVSETVVPQPGSEPTADPTAIPETVRRPAGDVKELRLGLVCYGGVSLAIYMHGITKEIHRAVRASVLEERGE